MSELRKDIVTREWVIIAPEREERSGHHPFSVASRPASARPAEPDTASCPFCPGNEAAEPETWAWRSPGSPPNSPHWCVRVIPNKYPALSLLRPVSRNDHHIYDCMTGAGAHELVVETPRHGVNVVAEPVANLVHVLEAYQARYQALSQNPQIEHVSVFKNHGWEAGASIPHAHSQIVATPVIPQLVWNNKQGQIQYREYRDTCVYCDVIQAELSLNERLIASNDHFVGLSPFAARYPFEIWIVPRRHAASFATLSADERLALAEILHLLLTRLADALDDPPYNYLMVSAPCKMVDQDDSFHWHMEIIPRLSVVAGFELGSNIFINTVTPEGACSYLRKSPKKKSQNQRARELPHEPTPKL